MITLKNLKQTASIMTTSAALLCCIPHEGMCSDYSIVAKELVQKAVALDFDALFEQVTCLEQKIISAEDPLSEGRALFSTLINELNVQYGTSYTLHDICCMIRTNLDYFQIPEYSKEEFLDVLMLLETKDSQNGHYENEWNFFKKSKKENRKRSCPPEVWIALIIVAGTVGICVLCPAAAPAAAAALGKAAEVFLSKPSYKN